MLVSAVSWRADFLVTGDKKHFDGLKAGSVGISEAKSVSGVILAAGFAAANFGCLYVFVIKCVVGIQETKGGDEEKRQLAIHVYMCYT